MCFRVSCEFLMRQGDVDQVPDQDPQRGPEKIMLVDHHQGQFCEGVQLNLEAFLGRSLLCYAL